MNEFGENIRAIIRKRLGISLMNMLLESVILRI
jgi:hypothetical protein